MTAPHSQGFAAVARLRTALEETAAALVSADLERLLQSEGELELALRSVPNPRDLPDEERAAVLDEVMNARVALQRCRRLGEVLIDVVRLTFEAQGRTLGYGPKDIPATYERHTLDARG